MSELLSNPYFYLAAVPAMLIFGISKGGLGAGLGVMGVPIISLVMPVSQAAAIMLPVLCLMDLFAVFAYRKRLWNKEILLNIIPAGALGILLGSFFLTSVRPEVLKISVGLIAILYFLKMKFYHKSLEPKRTSKVAGGFWGAVSGFTSTIAHSGGPPISIYLLPLRLDKTIFLGTTVIYFTTVNYLKLIPYMYLDLINTENMYLSVILMPIAPVGIFLGVWLKNRINEKIFYEICYWSLLITGLKLTWDGLSFYL